MRRLTKPQKEAIARDYVSGKSIADVCRTHGISESALYRLRREDETYQEYEDAFASEARDSVSVLLHHHAGAALQALRDILDLSAQNFTEATGPNGGKVVTRRVDPKLISEKRLAADCLLTHWQRLSEHRQQQRNWERLNLVSPDDSEESNDDGWEYDDADAAALLERARSLTH